MNACTQVLVFDVEAAVERLDAIAQTVQACRWVASGDRNLEGDGALRNKHTDRWGYNQRWGQWL